MTLFLSKAEQTMKERQEVLDDYVDSVEARKNSCLSLVYGSFTAEVRNLTQVYIKHTTNYGMTRKIGSTALCPDTFDEFVEVLKASMGEEEWRNHSEARHFDSEESYLEVTQGWIRNAFEEYGGHAHYHNDLEEVMPRTFKECAKHINNLIVAGIGFRS